MSVIMRKLGLCASKKFSPNNISKMSSNVFSAKRGLRVLLTNDDGIDGKGLKIMSKCLRSEHHDVFIVAPHENKSGVGSAKTITGHLRIAEVDLGVPGVRALKIIGGTPVDCTNFALSQMRNNLPDIVISGPNNGYNLGIDIRYSGTFAAARRAVDLGVPGLAVSCHGPEQFKFASDFITKNVEKLRKILRELPETILNINIPNDKTGIEITSLGDAVHTDYYEKCMESNGETFYMLKTSFNYKGSEGTDKHVTVAKKMISVTPVLKTFNQTDRSVLQAIKNHFGNAKVPEISEHHCIPVIDAAPALDPITDHYTPIDFLIT